MTGVLCLAWLTATANAQESLRPAIAEEATTPLPPGWKSIERTLYDAYSKAQASGLSAQTPGGIDRTHYRLKLLPDGSLMGEASATMRLAGEPAILPLGRPSFAISDAQVGGEAALWGTDPAGVTSVFCAADGAELRFQCSQQGVTRGDALEFPLEWLKSVAVRLDLTVPAGHFVETQGLLKTGAVNEPDGGLRLSFEAGSRQTATVRIRPRDESAARPFGMEVRQTVSASSTKVIIQSIVGILSASAGPVFAEFEPPEGFTILRATLGAEERLPVEHSPHPGGPVQIPLGELSQGQRVDLHVVMERPADWSRPLSVPRVAPRNGILLREEWSLQIERPLELLHVDAPDHILTSLSVEPAREVWTYQGTSNQAALTLTARAPNSEWTADYYVRRRQQGPRTEVLTLIDLKSRRLPLFEFDVNVLKPWKIVSVTAPDAVGNPVSLSFKAIEEAGDFVRHRIVLRTPAAPQRGATITIAAARQSAAATEAAGPRPVVLPADGGAKGHLIVPAAFEKGDLKDGLGAIVPLDSLRPGLRGHSFFETARSAEAAIRQWGASPAAESTPGSAKPATFPPAATASHPAGPPLPLADAAAVAEMRTAIGSSRIPSSHRVLFVFDQPVDVSGAVVRFPGPWDFVEVSCDGVPLSAVASGQELRLPSVPRGTRELLIRYTTPVAAAGVPRRDQVAWPQISASVENWTWHIDSSPQRQVSSIDAPSRFVAGLPRPSLRERLLAPLGRQSDDPFFNPFQMRSWTGLLDPPRPFRTPDPTQTALISVAGRGSPETTGVVSWPTHFLDALDWVWFFGALLTVVVIRRFKRGTFRFAAIVSASAATAAWLLPVPLASMAGAFLCGHLLGYCVPRRLLAPQSGPAPRRAGSSMLQLAGATALLIAGLLSNAASALIDRPTAPPNVLLLEREGQPAPVVFVSDAVDAEISAWQRNRQGPAFLVRDARYDISLDQTELASARLNFDLVIPRPDLTRAVQLPFEGLTFRSPEAVLINGEQGRLVPNIDGSGILLALPDRAPEDAEAFAEFKIELDAAFRVSAVGARRGFAVTIPACAAAVATLRGFDGSYRGDVRSSGRGRTRTEKDEVVSALGTISKWHARWRTGENADRTPEPAVTARAESVVRVDPLSLFVQTRLTIENPELADPFASTRLELLLPGGSIVSDAQGPSLVNWRSRVDNDGLRLFLDFSSPPIVGQSVDLQYEIPAAPSPRIEIPPIPLLTTQGLSSHQVAVVATSPFQVEMLSKPDPDGGLWAIEPSEASFSIRRDRGLPIPDGAIELERPASLLLSFGRRPVGRTAELEQTLTSAANSVSWAGAARVESSVRPAFLYEFRIDPSITITSASVIERDVERLSRFVREGDRLLLVVGDDRLGTKNVRLEGELRLEAGKIRPVPRFDLANMSITRRELVVTSSIDQLLQIRRGEDALLGGSEPEWEPRSPASQRFPLAGQESNWEMRWINPASPLKVVEFLRLPDRDDSVCSIEWRLESSRPLPATLAIDALGGTRISQGSAFVEESRRPLSENRVRIELQLQPERGTDARILMTMPFQVASGQSSLLPRLSDLSVTHVTYLAVPRDVLADFDVQGDFLDALPAAAPGDWSASFESRKLLVFLLSDIDWRFASTSRQTPIGEAALELLIDEGDNSVHGQSRFIITPSRAGVLRLKSSREMNILSVRGSTGAHIERDETDGWTILLRPSQPVALLVEWSALKRPPVDDSLPGPSLPGLDVRIACRALAGSPDASEWTPEFLSTPPGDELLAAARLESLLAAARKLPIGVRPPAWLRDELLDLSRKYEHSDRAGALAVQVEGLLESWSARMSSLTATHSVAPDSSRVTRPPHQVLAERMLVAAADPRVVVHTPAIAADGPASRQLMNSLLVCGWFLAWALLVTKGGQWAARHDLTNRIASHPGAALFFLGLAWWLLLKPSLLGLLLALAGAAWEGVLIYQRRPDNAPGSAPGIS